MGMAAGGSGDYKSDINITPLVDVVLVLLIIFMVITPLLQMGYDVKVPPKANVENPRVDPDQLIVSLAPGNKLFLNKQELTPPQLSTQLSSILKNRRDKTVFFSGDDASTYGEVAHVMDLCRSAGATNIGIVLETVPVQ
ncbi:MAG TPA: biopolymer transporter ExbD [Thermoanaerobaculia bacterium]|nr:biopolymer transporter ExbD [Thermoanaerobaculia bacterium]